MKDKITLPGIGCSYTLPVTLALVAALEEKTTVMKAAEQLVARQMKLSEMLDHLRGCYRLAGCETPRADLDAHLMTQSPALLLAEILCAVLAPASAMGAIKLGEPKESDWRRIDITSLRRFFMGVLGWTPDTLRHAGLPDLCDAYLGHAAWHGIAPAPTPTKEFMTAMLQQFPDRKGQ